MSLENLYCAPSLQVENVARTRIMPFLRASITPVHLIPEWNESFFIIRVYWTFKCPWWLGAVNTGRYSLYHDHALNSIGKYGKSKIYLETFSVNHVVLLTTWKWDGVIYPEIDPLSHPRFVEPSGVAETSTLRAQWMLSTQTGKFAAGGGMHRSVETPLLVSSTKLHCPKSWAMRPFFT